MISQDQIDAAKAAHGDVRLLTSDGVQVLIRKPRPGEYKRWRRDSMDAARRADALEDLLRAITVAPDAAGLAALLEERPGLAEEFAGAMLELVGITGRADAKKL